MLTVCLTVLFEPPFWVGIFERTECGYYEVCKVTFGAEPKDYAVYAFVLQNWSNLTFSAPIKKHVRSKSVSPKRLQRVISRCMDSKGMGTKAQQALQRQQQQAKEQRRASRKERRDSEQEKRFVLRQEKKKAKHRGK